MATDPARPEVAWIVGVGAEAGLGSALARRFAAGGMTVVVTGRTSARVQAVTDAIGAAGHRAIALPGDISDPREAERLGAAVSAAGRLRAAIFNAGNAVRGGTLELSVDAFEATWRGSTFAGFLFAREALRGLLASGEPAADSGALGSLIFTGATASLRGGARFAAFASAKAGLRSLAQSAAREFGPQGIHVAHVVIDGGIDGERLRSNSPQRVAEAGKDGLLDPAAIADNYWHLHRQHRSAWTFELDLRPFKENF